MELLRKADAVAAVRRRADELSPRFINVITSRGVRQWSVCVLEHAIWTASVIYWDYAEHYQLTIELDGRKFRADVRNVTASALVRPYLDNLYNVDNHGGRHRAPATGNTGSCYYRNQGRDKNE